MSFGINWKIHLLSQALTEGRKSGWAERMMAFEQSCMEVVKDSLVESVQHNYIA